MFASPEKRTTTANYDARPSFHIKGSGNHSIKGSGNLEDISTLFRKGIEET